MPPVMIGTQESTINIDQSQRVVDMADSIYLLQPEDNPFQALLRKISKRSAKNPEYSWLEDEQVPWTDVAAAAWLVGATTITMTNGGYFAAGDIIKVFRTAEVMRVTSVAVNVITVVRGWGGTTAVAGNIGDVIIILGPAIAEGQPVGAARMTKKVKKRNYTQIFRHPVKVTKTLEASALYGTPSERAFQRRKIAFQHLTAIERALWFGVANEDVSAADAPIRSTGGVTSFVVTNKTSLANDAALTLAAFDAFWETVFFYGSGTRWAFASPHIMTLVNALGQSKLQLMQMDLGKVRDQVFGISVTQYVSPHGIVNLVMTRQFKDWIASTGSNAAGKVLIALDFDPEDGVAYRYLQSRDTQLLTDLQQPGDDFYLDEYKTECGLMLAQEKRHGILEVIA